MRCHAVEYLISLLLLTQLFKVSTVYILTCLQLPTPQGWFCHRTFYEGFRVELVAMELTFTMYTCPPKICRSGASGFVAGCPCGVDIPLVFRMSLKLFAHPAPFIAQNDNFVCSVLGNNFIYANHEMM